MTTIYTRRIYFSAPGAGLTAKDVHKRIEGVAPIVGAVLDDSAWHRNDEVKILNVIISTSEPDVYYAELTPKQVEIATDVQRYVEMTKSHGWSSNY